jgi:hypothetical protein
MRMIYKYCIILLVGLLVSCEKNLDPQLSGTINTENFFKTRQDLDAATTTIYYELRQDGWAPYMFNDGSAFVMDEVATGEWTTAWSWTNFLNGNWNVNDPMAIGFYNSMNKAVTRATYTMARIEDSPVEASVKDGYVAQLRALRAFFVFDMYRLYGPVPLIVEKERALTPDPDYKPARPSAASVETFIVTELKSAAAVLPVEQAEYGRVTKGAALHYLLKYYMHKKDWQNALTTANQIIGLGYYSLQDNYANVFSATNEKNREVMAAMLM